MHVLTMHVLTILNLLGFVQLVAPQSCYQKVHRHLLQAHVITATRHIAYTQMISMSAKSFRGVASLQHLRKSELTLQCMHI